MQLLTWSNQFQEDRDQLIEFLVCGASMDAKLDLICWESCVPLHELDTLHCSDNQKLRYAAKIAAIRYDNDHKYVSHCGEPNMLYSLIREFPNNLNVV